jgi:predicted dehydrogenase
VLAGSVESSGIAFMVEFARRFYPATLRLRELLATTLGNPRLILGQNRLFGFDRYGQPGPTTQMAPAPLMIDPGSYLLDWCCSLFQAEPVAVQGFAGVALPAAAERGAGPDFESFVAEFADGAMAQIAFGRYHRDPWGEASRVLPQAGFQVYAERGAAWLELPERIQWSDAQGVHEERLPLEPTVGDVLNDQFHRLVRGDQSMAPTIRDALSVARRVGDLRRSQREGRMISRPSGPR